MSSAGDDEASAGRLRGPGWDWGGALSGGGRSVAAETGPTVLRPRLHAPVSDLRPSRFGRVVVDTDAAIETLAVAAEDVFLRFGLTRPSWSRRRCQCLRTARGL